MKFKVQNCYKNMFGGKIKNTYIITDTSIITGAFFEILLRGHLYFYFLNSHYMSQLRKFISLPVLKPMTS